WILLAEWHLFKHVHILHYINPTIKYIPTLCLRVLVEQWHVPCISISRVQLFFCKDTTFPRNFQGFREKILEKGEEKKKIGGSRIGGEPPIEYCCFDDETKDYLFFDFPMASKCRRTNTLYSFLSL
ncbi:MAG: hypothetical protein U0K49_11105, partial [Segatella copri]|nr:hypothetical protein [Segatella copri]